MLRYTASIGTKEVSRLGSEPGNNCPIIPEFFRIFRKSGFSRKVVLLGFALARVAVCLRIKNSKNT
jgi:hypothetical protein